MTKIKHFFIGKPLSMEQQKHELIPKWKALAVLSSDALSSVAYATEEILVALFAFGTLALNWSIPIAGAIVLLLIIVAISYRQTIESYPNGGGAYVVAKENLGQTAGLVAGAALMIDYILTVSVSVAAGVGNLASAIPMLQEHTVLIEVIIILLLMTLSLRGVSESATIFAIPCYLFMFSMLVMIVKGIVSSHAGDINPVTEVLTQNYPDLALIIILRAFASGCSAMTGVEAISNGVPIFREPKKDNAKSTLTMMAIILAFFFAGITYLAHIYGIRVSEDQTVISSLSRAVFGNSILYYLVPTATAVILFTAASTSYAGFPGLASLLAKDRYAPRQLASLGDRLVFSNSIIGLSILAIALVIMFGGNAHHLIPLYAVGVFLSFTLSQAGMVVHHLKLKEKGWALSLVINFVGMISTFTVLLVISYTKFTHGAWIVILLIPTFVFLFTRIHAHYMACAEELTHEKVTPDFVLKPLHQTVVMPISGLHRGVIDAYRYAKSLSEDLRVCYIEIDPAATVLLEKSLAEAIPELELTILDSPYRSVLTPLLKYIDMVLKTSDVDFVTVVLPEFVTRKWYHQFLHNQTALWIRAYLLFKPRVIVTSVRYHLKGR